MAARTARVLLREHIPADALGRGAPCSASDAVDALTLPPRHWRDPATPPAAAPALPRTDAAAAPQQPRAVRRFTAAELAAARAADEPGLARLEALAAVFRPQRPRAPRHYGAGPVTLVARTTTTAPPSDDDAAAPVLLQPRPGTATTITFAPGTPIPALLAAPQTAPPCLLHTRSHARTVTAASQ